MSIPFRLVGLGVCCLTYRSKILHSYEDVTVTSKSYQSLFKKNYPQGQAGSHALQVFSFSLTLMLVKCIKCYCPSFFQIDKFTGQLYERLTFSLYFPGASSAWKLLGTTSKIQSYTWSLWPKTWIKRYLSCHTCYDTGPRFFQSHPKDRSIQSSSMTSIVLKHSFLEMWLVSSKC